MKWKTKDLQELVPKLREKDFYQPKQQRQIDWSSYTLNQINDLIDTLNFIRDEVDKVYVRVPHKKVGKPPIDPGNLAKSILFVELNCVPERKAQGWIKLLGHHMGIDEHIDDRVLGKAYCNDNVIAILEKIFKNNRESDGQLGGDGTGLEKSRKENYESTKKKDLYMTSIVDSREIVQSFDISGTQECQIMHKLVKELKNVVITSNSKNPKLTLDAGFIDRELAQLIENSGLIPFIFPKKHLTLKSRGKSAMKKMLILLLDKTQEWLREYHVRSHTESFHSSLKRIFGIITKINDIPIYTQVLTRIIHNNRRKLNYFKMAAI